MARRPLSVLCVLLGASLSLAATYRTPNFVVEAATPQIAQQVGQYAEHYRKEKALQWLGTEMPRWGQPCPLRVTVTMGGSGGATSFAFDSGRVLSQKMHIEGTLERLLASVLPHEVTHTVFAYHYRQPVPRWADEGGSVLSEDDIERKRHDRLVRNILNNRRAMPLRRLFALKEYPPDVMVLYAQGFSVCDFLVGRSSRPAFLNFIADGMRSGWDNAVQQHYGFRNVEELEQAWLQHLRDTKQQQPTEVARGVPPAGTTTSALADQVVVRNTVPPAAPLDDAPGPIYRGVAPTPDERGQSFQPTSRQPVPMDGPVVRLGAPQFFNGTPATPLPIPGE